MNRSSESSDWGGQLEPVSTLRADVSGHRLATVRGRRAGVRDFRDTPGPWDPHGPSRSTAPDWLRIVQILRKNWRLSALFTIAVVATSTLVLLTVKPTFEPQAHLEVDPPGAEVFSLQGNNNSGASTDYMETQVQNLQADELALEVIEKLRLDRSPYFGRELDGPKELPVVTDPLVPATPGVRKALAVFKQSRKITRDAASRLITVSVSAPDAVVAATVTNALVHLFIERDYTLRNRAISQSSRWLEAQLADVQQRMSDSNLALTAFEKEHGTGMMGDTQSRYSEETLELSRQLVQAQAERISLQSYLQALKENQGNSLPQTSSNPVVQDLTKRLAEVKGQLAETRVIYGAGHPNSIKLQRQADELQLQVNAEDAQILRDMKMSYSAAQTREHSMQSRLEGASQKMTVLAQYGALKKIADADAQLYQELYQKIKEAAIAAETKSSNVRVVDQARVLDRPTRPHRGQDLGASLVIGLFGGVVLAFLREGFDTRIHTPEDVRQCVGAGSVSVIPLLGVSKGTTRDKFWPQTVPRDSDGSSYLIQLDRPNSPQGEALRSIGVSVRLPRKAEATPQVLLIASPLPGEGKTTVAVNLALTLAQHGKTCIVDGDLRRESVARALGITAEYGLREVLSGRLSLEQALIHEVKLPDLSMLAAGSAFGEPGEAISSSTMASLIGKLRSKFEFVVIDSPPILMFSDARALSALADGVIIVGRSGVTRRESLTQAMDLLDAARSAPIIDLVLNGADFRASVYDNYRSYGMAS